MDGPIRVAQERDMCSPENAEVNAQAAGRTILQDDFGKVAEQSLKHMIVTLVVLVQSIACTMPMIRTVTTGLRIEVKVQFDPIAIDNFNQAAQSLIRPFLGGRIAQAEVAKQRLSTHGCEFWMRGVEVRPL